ncbi:ASCH domain-containing protein [Arthrobacter sp. G119Y2]|uniref:ASCH domain-containing protein n=1 Tax=Arthrobacter sp. G119Y2 TaxID=3134965 RepID=UPI00311A05A8
MEPHLPYAEFAFPGPLRDALVRAILDGSKTSTTSLALQYDDDGGEPLPRPGDRSILIGSSREPLAVLEVTGIRLVPLGAVDLQHARDEGEGHGTLEEWRAAHEDFWHGEEFRSALGDPAFTVDDCTMVLLERFRVIQS